MRIPRSRGAVSGLLLMILGAWGALIPFIGPYFDVVIGSDEAWDWSNGRLWLSVVPGVVAFVGGFLLLRSAHRAGAGFGAWMGILAGAWFVVGPTVSMLWNDGESAVGTAAGDTERQVLELLVMYEGLGVLIAVLGAFALGRLAVRSVKDAELAREAELEGRREGAGDTGVDRDDDDRFRREPGARPAAEREPVAVAPAPPATGSVPPRTEAPTTTNPTSTTRSPVPPAERTTVAPAEEPRRDGGLLGRMRRD